MQKNSFSNHVAYRPPPDSSTGDVVHVECGPSMRRNHIVSWGYLLLLQCYVRLTISL